MKKSQLIPIFLLGSSFFLRGQQIDERPNILLILSDDQSFPFIGCAGNSDMKTPNIDGLAYGGVLYKRAYTTAPQSVPSRASLMTGRNVLDVHMSRFSAPLQRRYVTFPEILRGNGYYTGICGRSYHLDGSKAKASETIGTFEKYMLQTFQDRVDFLKIGDDDEVLDQFNDFLDHVPLAKPFFIQVGFSDPHRPWKAPDFEPDPNRIKVPDGMPDIPELRKDMAAHYGEIMRMDANLGKVLDELDKREIKNVMIIFMGDNGSAVLRGKGTLYDAGIHVPLIVKWEGKTAKNVVSDVLISGEDIAPTILDAAGSAIPKEMSGKSFIETFTGEHYEIRDFAYAVRVAHGSGLPEGSASFDLSRTVLSKEFKLIYNVLWQLPYSPVDFAGAPLWKSLKNLKESGQLAPVFVKLFFSRHRPMFELYDLKNDPLEMNNLAGRKEYASIEKKYKALLHEWMILYEDYCPLPIEP
ncbi:MAG: sulfatase [Paludibacter sp.]|nr:sulfatase [Paludibacter sp.]